MAVLETITPIFLMIIFGAVLQRQGFLKPDFIESMNRFVYLFPLPVLIFTGIIKSSLQDMTISHLAIMIIPILMIVGLAFGVGLAAGLRHGKLGSFVQTTFHGNVSYIGLALLFYLLGEEGLKKGSVFVGILIFVNNSLAIAVLSSTAERHGNMKKALLSIAASPVILATVMGLVVLYAAIPIPGVIKRSMAILANIALPMALILIGASMSLGTIRQSLKFSSLASVFKLFLLPGMALVLCKFNAVSPQDALPIILLLTVPTAISTYVMAREMGGDEHLASGTVALSTLLSPLVFILWIWIVALL